MDPMWMFDIIAATCKFPKDDFLGFPYWYKYLDGVIADGVCVPRLEALNHVWLVVAAIIEMMLRFAALAAVGIIIYGGIQYTTSQADPGNLEKAKSTIVNALIGLIIAVVGITVVSYVAGRFV